MDRIVLDTDVLVKLTGVRQPVELCDATGRIFGQFTPAVVLPRPLWNRESMRPS